MKEVIRLVRVDFDNMENRDGVVETEIGVFGCDADGSPHTRIKKWFATLPPEKMYVGWDGKAYPQFRLEVRTVL